MKKYLPILLFILAFFGYLAWQIADESYLANAGLAPEDKQSKLHYESLFRETQLVSTDGELFSLEKDQAPVVILNFWASWCSNCMLELPTLNDLKKKFGDRELKIITINTDNQNPEEMIKRVSKKLDLILPIVADPEGSLSRDFNVSAIPVSFVFKRGELVEISKGLKDFASEEMVAQINSWQNQSSK